MNKRMNLITERENPENREVNKKIKDILTGDSRRYTDIKKMGYDVNIDDSARKEFGKRYFGKNIEITNPKTGRKLYANVGKDYTPDTIIAKGDEERNSKWHKLSGHSGALHKGNKDKFDYKNFLDSPTPEREDNKLTTVQQYRKDKQFLKDMEYDAKRIDDARNRISNIRSKYNLKPQTESLSEVEDKAREAQNPVYADAIRGIKRADKAREEYRKLPKAEVREENPKVKGNSDMKKMYLSESLFEDVTKDINKNKFIGKSYKTSDGSIYKIIGRDDNKYAMGHPNYKCSVTKSDGTKYVDHVGTQNLKTYIANGFFKEINDNSLSEEVTRGDNYSYEGDYIVQVYSYSDNNYDTRIEQCLDNNEAASWFDELNQMTDKELNENGLDGFAWLTVDDEGNVFIVDERISGFADTAGVQKEIDYFVNTKQKNESLFEDSDFTYEGDYIVTVYSYRDGSYKTHIEQCNDNHEAAAWFDELNQMTDDKLVENGIDGFAWLTIDDDGTTVIVDERISGYADTNAVQREIDYYVNTKQQNESLNESTSNVDINKLSNFIKNAVNGLTKNDESTWYFHLVDNLYYVIGVVNPENYDKEDLKILALSKDGWVICGKIAVNIDDMQSDYELDWYMPYEKDGEVWDTERDFYKNDDYTKVAQDIIRDLHNFDNVTVDKNGEIITNKITDEACKSKKRVKKQLKEDSEIHVFDQIPDEEIYDQANYVFSNDGLYGRDYTDGLIIGGNRDYSSIIYSKEHKDEIKELLYSGYSSDEIVQELNKITGKTYVADQISGYSQSDWNNIYYPTGEFSNDFIREIEDAYFGKYTAYDDGNELVVVFDSDRRPVKEIISDQTGIPVNQIKIRKFTGYTRTPNYEDDED